MTTSLYGEPPTTGNPPQTILTPQGQQTLDEPSQWTSKTCPETNVQLASPAVTKKAC